MLNCQQSTGGTAGFQRSLSLKAGLGFGCQFIKRVRSAVRPPPSHPYASLVSPLFTPPGWAVRRGACRPAPWWSTRSLSCWSGGPGPRCYPVSAAPSCRSPDAHTPGSPPEPGGHGQSGGPEICMRTKRSISECSTSLFLVSSPL